MIKLIKIDNLIYQNIEEKAVNENGNEIWNIPNTVEELKPVVLDTINWWVGNKVKKSLGDFTKLSAANSKAIALLASVLASLTPDTSNLTDLQKSAFDKMVKLGGSEYTDSNLLNNSLDRVVEFIHQGAELSTQATQAKSVEKLIDILNKLR